VERWKNREIKERQMKGSKMERREMEKGGTTTGGHQAACLAFAPIHCLRQPKTFY
jgi:hypothetical protein